MSVARMLTAAIAVVALAVGAMAEAADPQTVDLSFRPVDLAVGAIEARNIALPAAIAGAGTYQAVEGTSGCTLEFTTPTLAAGMTTYSFKLAAPATDTDDNRKKCDGALWAREIPKDAYVLKFAAMHGGRTTGVKLELTLDAKAAAGANLELQSTDDKLSVKAPAGAKQGKLAAFANGRWRLLKVDGEKIVPDGQPPSWKDAATAQTEWAAFLGQKSKAKEPFDIYSSVDLASGAEAYTRYQAVAKAEEKTEACSDKEAAEYVKEHPDDVFVCVDAVAAGKPVVKRPAPAVLPTGKAMLVRVYTSKGDLEKIGADLIEGTAPKVVQGVLRAATKEGGDAPSLDRRFGPFEAGACKIKVWRKSGEGAAAKTDETIIAFTAQQLLYMGALRTGVAIIAAPAVDRLYEARSRYSGAQREIVAKAQPPGALEAVVGFTAFLPWGLGYPSFTGADTCGNMAWGVYGGLGIMQVDGQTQDPLRVLKSVYLGIDWTINRHMSIEFCGVARSVKRLDPSVKVGQVIDDNENPPMSDVPAFSGAIVVNFSPWIVEQLGSRKSSEEVVK